MAKQIEHGVRTLTRIHEALGLPADFGITGFKLDVGVRDLAKATIAFIPRVHQIEKLGELLGHYELTPKQESGKESEPDGQ